MTRVARDAQRRDVPARRPRDRAGHRGAHPGGRAVAGARRLPGRPHHQRSDYAHETLARLLPLRDVFVALFFVTIGALIDPAQSSSHNVPLLATMVALVVVGKLVLRTRRGLALRPVAAGPRCWSGWGSPRSASSPSSWSRSRATAGHVGAEIYNATLAASLITILINAALVRTVPGWIGRLRGVERAAAPAGWRGAGRRSTSCSAASAASAARSARRSRPSASASSSSSGIRTSCGAALARAVPCLFGDAAQPRLLERGGVARGVARGGGAARDGSGPARRAGRPRAEPARADPGARAQRLGPRRPRPRRAPPR